MSTFPTRNQLDYYVENAHAETWRNIFLNNRAVPPALKSIKSAVIPTKQPLFIESIPAEIWTEIFLNTRTVPTKHILQAQRGLSRLRRNLFSLSQICHRLRAIAVDSPCLWTWIYVDLESDSHTPAQNLYLTRLALQRSKDSPLSVWMHNIWEIDGRHLPNNECFYLVMEQMAKWKNAFLSWEACRSEIQPWFVAFDDLIGPAPLLESLIMHPKIRYHSGGDGHISLPARIWAASPRLRRLEVTREYVDEEDRWSYEYEDPTASWVLTDGIPFDRLTDLRLSPLSCEIISSDKLVLMFRSSPNLVSCFIGRLLVLSSDPNALGVSSVPVPVPVPLQHLRHLYFFTPGDNRSYFQQGLSVITILDCILAPSLVTLTTYSEKPWKLGTFKNFIERSSCQLEDLNIIGFTCAPVLELNAIVALTPSLRAVHLDDLSPTEEFIRMWMGWDGMEGRYNFWPNLERFSVNRPTLYGFNASDLLTTTTTATTEAHETHETWLPSLTEMLRSRLLPPSGAPKTFSTFLFPSHVESWDLIREIHALCNEPTGLKIGFNDDLGEGEGRWDEYVSRR